MKRPRNMICPGKNSPSRHMMRFYRQKSTLGLHYFYCDNCTFVYQFNMWER